MKYHVNNGVCGIFIYNISPRICDIVSDTDQTIQLWVTNGIFSTVYFVQAFLLCLWFEIHIDFNFLERSLLHSSPLNVLSYSL